jgi:endonuclease/exonuclease/phosphatase family metal-dependent hydrolase
MKKSTIFVLICLVSGSFYALWQITIPKPSPTPSPTPSSTPSPTPSSTPSPTPSSTPSPTPSSTPSPTPTDIYGAQSIRIAAFNIQIFGRAKREKSDVMEVLTEIAREFDVMLVQEIRDSSEETAPYFLQLINEAGDPTYEYVRSERLGRTTSKEAYAYFYNNETVDFIEGSDFVYNDTFDIFEREPYIASFTSGSFDFTLVGIHTKPDDAYSEIGNLTLIVQYLLETRPEERDIIVLGDFNADGSYFDEEDPSNPFKAQVFFWVVTNGMDTMTKTDWTYDRMVMLNATYNHEYINDSAQVFYFDLEYGLDDEELVWAVSDHYPIYAEFKTNLVDDD